VTTLISSIRDIEGWAANCLNIDDEQAKRLADAIWQRADFPHPVNNSALDDYLEALDTDWLYEMAGEEE